MGYLEIKYKGKVSVETEDSIVITSAVVSDEKNALEQRRGLTQEMIAYEMIKVCLYTVDVLKRGIVSDKIEVKNKEFGALLNILEGFIKFLYAENLLDKKSVL